MLYLDRAGQKQGSGPPVQMFTLDRKLVCEFQSLVDLKITLEKAPVEFELIAAALKIGASGEALGYRWELNLGAMSLAGKTASKPAVSAGVEFRLGVALVQKNLHTGTSNVFVHINLAAEYTGLKISTIVQCLDTKLTHTDKTGMYYTWTKCKCFSKECFCVAIYD
jgi:hypothetical protein